MDAKTKKLHRAVDIRFINQLPVQPERYERIRFAGGQLAHLLVDSCPSGLELNMALFKLEEVMELANMAITREGGVSRARELRE